MAIDFWSMWAMTVSKLQIKIWCTYSDAFLILGLRRLSDSIFDLGDGFDSIFETFFSANPLVGFLPESLAVASPPLAKEFGQQHHLAPTLAKRQSQKRLANSYAPVHCVLFIHPSAHPSTQRISKLVHISFCPIRQRRKKRKRTKYSNEAVVEREC